MKNIILNTSRVGYTVEQAEDYKSTMTVEELISFLQDFDGDQKIYLSFDRGYTYGSFNEDDFEEVEEETDEEEESED